MINQHQRIKLENISVINYGRSINKSFIHKEKSTLLFVQSGNFSIDGINWDECSYTDFVGMKEHYPLKQGDILFLVRGEGDKALLLDGSINSVDLPVIAGPLMFILRCDETKIMPEYLAWWLNQKPAQEYFKSKDIVGERRNVTRQTLQDTPVSVPSLIEQKSILASYTQKQKEIVELQAILDDMAWEIEKNSKQLSHRLIDNLL